jgi:hypothetical protein
MNEAGRSLTIRVPFRLIRGRGALVAIDLGLHHGRPALIRIGRTGFAIDRREGAVV